MTADSAGNVYLTGSTSSLNFSTTAGALQTKPGGGRCLDFVGSLVDCTDVFVTKLDPRGAVIFSTYLGGDGQDEGTAIRFDSSGNIYVAGSTLRNHDGVNHFPVTAGAAFRNPSSLEDAFIVKLSPGGDRLLYSSLIPGASGPSIELDPQGNVYFCGTVNAERPFFPVTRGAFRTTPPNEPFSAVAVAKVRADGSALMYSTYIGSGVARGLTVDATGNAYLVGSTQSPNFPVTPGAFQTKLSNPESAFVTKLNPDGTALVYSTYLGGTKSVGDSIANSIQVDYDGHAYIFGETSSPDFPTTPSVFQPSGPASGWAPNPSASGFLTKLNSDASSLEYSTYLPGASAAAVDSAGKAYVLGETSYGLPVTAGAFQACMGGGIQDLSLIQLTPTGVLAGASYYGGPGFESAGSIAPASDGSVIMTGSSQAPPSPDSPGTPQNPPSQFVAHVRINDPKKHNGLCMSPNIQNAASYIEGPVSPGELVTFRGYAFGPEIAADLQIDTNGTATANLSGVRVFFDELLAPLLYAQSLQINAIVPWQIAGRTTVKVHVEFNGIPSNEFVVGVVPATIGIFYTDYLARQSAILDQDGTLNSESHPSERGSVIQIFGTGGGLTDPPGVTGGFWPLSPLARLQLPVKAAVMGRTADILYAGGAPGGISGEFQVNLRIPIDVPLGTNFLDLQIGDSKTTALIAVK